MFNMKSPFTGKEMLRVFEERTWKFRGEEYSYIHSAWRCEDTGELFTDDESDTAGFVQVTNQYREKYGIPYKDEIIAVRSRYGISAAKMSLILGLGVNQYRLYEQGEVPSVSNGRMIRSIMNPSVMLDMVESSRNELSEAEYGKISNRIRTAIWDGDNRKIIQHEVGRVFSSPRGAVNGYAPLSLDRLKNVLLYVLEHCSDVWCTKMNKLLFYIDFLSYRENGMAVTGLAYRAFDYGPVPERWDVAYSEFPEVKQELRSIGDFEGSVLVSDSKADMSLFSDMEKKVVDTICEKFGRCTSREISRTSHQEQAWIDHHTNHGAISFRDSFALKAV